MSHPVLFSHLWSKNQHVCVELARNHNFDIAALPDALTGDQIAEIERTGRRCIIVDAAKFRVDAGRAQVEGTARFTRLQTALPAHVCSIAGPELGARIGGAMLQVISQKIAGAMHFIDCLDALAARENVVGVLLNENDLPIGRAASLWCRAKNVRSFVLSHGAGIGEAYTVTAQAVADYMLFVGERGMEPYLDIGFPRDRMVVCGNPAWDAFPGILANRDSIREQVYRTIGLDPQTPLVVFGTTWNAHLTALHDAAIYEQTLAAFFRACRALSDAGVRFHAVVKDRPPNADVGKALTDKLAAQTGFTACSYATGDMFAMLVSADLFVGHDTSAFVEAAIAGVPSIDVWAPSCWLLGPALDRNDGIRMVEQSDHDELARAMGALLTDPPARARSQDRMQASLGRFVYACDGRAGERCAAAIASRLTAVPKAAPVELPEDGLWALAGREPRLILDVGTQQSLAATALRARYPAAQYVRVDAGDRDTRLPHADLVLLDDQLDRIYDPWAFLQHLRGRLAPSARILARLPNARNFAFLTDMVRGEWSYDDAGRRDRGRLRFFTKKSIVELFEQTGYRVDRMDASYDATVKLAQVPPESTFDIDAGAFAVKNLTRPEFDDLRTLDFLVEASPAQG